MLREEQDSLVSTWSWASPSEMAVPETGPGEAGQKQSISAVLNRHSG